MSDERLASDADIDALISEAGLSIEDENEAKTLISAGSTSISASLLSESPDVENNDIRYQLSQMRIPDKIKLALLGGAVCRQILVFDPNRIIQLFVLKNPRITQAEVEDFARNKSASEHVLRAIADNKNWMKNYKAKLAIVVNPKTPVDISLKWLKHLNATDIKKIARSKELPQVLVSNARKRVSQDAAEGGS